VFILYGVAAGIIVGRLLGGRFDRLADLRIRLAWLAIAALAVQIVLFLPAVGDVLGPLAAWTYVASSAAILIVVVANVRVPGVALIGAGLACNLAAIVANGGSMPASASALASLGWTEGSGYSNSVVVADPALAPLTDVFALPAWLPFANVFSVGDVLIAAGVAVTIALAMRRTGPSQSRGVRMGR
jgi:hypothetical protein